MGLVSSWYARPGRGVTVFLRIDPLFASETFPDRDLGPSLSAKDDDHCHQVFETLEGGGFKVLLAIGALAKIETT